MKIRTILATVLVTIFLSGSLALAAAVNWQAACTDENGSYFFDTNSVRTIGSSDVIRAQLKTDISEAGQQALIAHYADRQDTSSWHTAACVTATAIFNRQNHTATISSIRIYDKSNTLLAALTDEETLDMTTGSLPEKLSAQLAQWLYEN
jgi:hypothetical protein